MTPLSQVGGHDHLRLQTVRQHRPGLFGLRTVLQEVHIHAFGCGHGRSPQMVLQAFISPETGADEGQLLPEFSFAVIAVSGGLLGVGRQSVPHQLMGDATVADDPGGQLLVLNHRLVAFSEDTPDKVVGTFIGDVAFRFIASPRSVFTGLVK